MTRSKSVQAPRLTRSHDFLCTAYISYSIKIEEKVLFSECDLLCKFSFLLYNNAIQCFYRSTIHRLDQRHYPFFGRHNAPCNSKTVFVRLCALYYCVSENYVVRKYDAVTNPFHHRTSSANQNISSSSRYVSQSRPHVGRSGSTVG